MKPADHIQIIQEQLKLLNDEEHLTGKPSCWHFHIQVIQIIESLRTALIHEEHIKGESQ